jgi:release factor glutamine methyltransferase
MPHEGVQIRNCDGVYAPREDSFLLSEAVKKYAKGKTLDLGCGTGIQGITAAKEGCEVTFADRNEMALECARNNCALNGMEGHFLHTDLFSDVEGKFDTIIFNPPYVATAPLKRAKKVDISTDGGVMGREVIKRFVADCRKHLNPDGIILLLESSINNYGSDVKKYGAEIVGREKEFFEELVVLLIR